MIDLRTHQGGDDVLRLSAVTHTTPADREAAKQRQEDALRDHFFRSLAEASGRTVDARAGTTKGRADLTILHDPQDDCA